MNWYWIWSALHLGMRIFPETLKRLETFRKFPKKDRKHSEIFRSIGLVHGSSNKKTHEFTTVAERNVPLHFVLIPIFSLIFLGAWNTQHHLQAQALWDTLLIYTNVIIKKWNDSGKVSKFPFGNFRKISDWKFRKAGTASHPYISVTPVFDI